MPQMSGSSRTQKIVDLKATLDGEKEYPKTDQPLVYPFRIKIPPDVLKSQPKLKGGAGTVLEVAKFMSGMGNIKWHLTAKMDLPMGIGISKKIQINVA
jgi:hypothetical protein